MLRSERPEAITAPDTLFIHDLGREGVFVGVPLSIDISTARAVASGDSTEFIWDAAA